jgi:molybdopterin molybdotransferase
MIPVEEAYSVILDTVKITKSVAVDIKSCAGRIIREDIKADRNFPPYHRVMMDGIAIQFENWKQGKKKFKIMGTQAAGTPMIESDSKECIEIMTGAMMPAQYDTVIRYEDFVVSENGNDKIATINAEDIIQNQNVHAEGLDRRAGEVLIKKDTRISPAEVGVIASVGETIIQVADFPKAALISTGDELVEINENPEAYQIRRSNVYSIHAVLKEMGMEASLFHFKDDSQQIRKELNQILNEHDLLIISGGVSKGKFDFLPEALRDSGVEQLFHKVNQRPGKPFWFGKKPEGVVVFGLPGNPVSTFLCFYKYIKPFLMASMKGSTAQQSAILAEDFEINIPLTYFLQVKLTYENGNCIGRPVPGQGSGDFANLLDVDGFLELNPNAGAVKKGTILPLLPFR